MKKIQSNVFTSPGTTGRNAVNVGIMTPTVNVNVAAGLDPRSWGVSSIKPHIKFIYEARSITAN